MSFPFPLLTTVLLAASMAMAADEDLLMHLDSDEDPAVHATTLLRDSSGNIHNGRVVSNNTTANKSRPGVDRNALYFEGTDDLKTKATRQTI